MENINRINNLRLGEKLFDRKMLKRWSRVGGNKSMFVKTNNDTAVIHSHCEEVLLRKYISFG